MTKSYLLSNTVEIPVQARGWSQRGSLCMSLNPDIVAAGRSLSPCDDVLIMP